MRDLLHWLPVRQRINVKPCYIVRSCVVGTAPAWLQELRVFVSEIVRRQRLRSIAREDPASCVSQRTDLTGERSLWLEPVVGHNASYRY